MKKLNALLFLLSVMFLTACVEDFGDHWAKGTADPALGGRWQMVRAMEYSNNAWTEEKDNSESYDVKIIDGYLHVEKIMIDRKDDAPTHMKTIQLAGYDFFMAQSHEGKAVDLLRYARSEDGKTLKIYPLPKEKLVAAINNGEIAGRIDNGAPVAARLDDSLIHFIESLPKDDESWLKYIEYERVTP